MAADTNQSNDDFYDTAVAYIKSTLILDILASLPQLVTGIQPSVVIFKFIRIYRKNLLYYPFEAMVKHTCKNRDMQFKNVVVYAYSRLCYIILLLHYLSVFWVWIGSE